MCGAIDIILNRSIHNFKRPFWEYRKLLFLLLCGMMMVNTVTAQTEEWKYMHKGNRAFEAQDYAEAEMCYLKALQLNPRSAQALFNLGDVLLAKNNAEAALDYFDKSLNMNPDTLIQSMAYHNQGYIYQAAAMSSTKEDERQKLLVQAIEKYKHALRRNPMDDDTRYNLALCQKLLKPSSNQSQQQQQQNQENQQDQQEQQERQQQQSQPQQDDKKSEQLLNLSKQAEKKAKQKVDKALQNPRKMRLEKNW